MFPNGHTSPECPCGPEAVQPCECSPQLDAFIEDAAKLLGRREVHITAYQPIEAPGAPPFCQLCKGRGYRPAHDESRPTLYVHQVDPPGEDGVGYA